VTPTSALTGGWPGDAALSQPSCLRRNHLTFTATGIGSAVLACYWRA